MIIFAITTIRTNPELYDLRTVGLFETDKDAYQELPRKNSWIRAYRLKRCIMFHAPGVRAYRRI